MIRTVGCSLYHPTDVERGAHTRPLQGSTKGAELLVANLD